MPPASSMAPITNVHRGITIPMIEDTPCTYTVSRSTPLGTVTTADINIPVFADNPVRLPDLLGGDHQDNFISTVFPLIEPHILNYNDGDPIGIIVQFFIRRIAPVPAGQSVLMQVHFSTPMIKTTTGTLGIADMALRDVLLDRLTLEEDSGEYDELIAGDSVLHAVFNVRVGVFNMPQAVGCWGDMSSTQFPSRISRFLTDPPSSEFNCFYACLFYRYKDSLIKHYKEITRYTNQRDTHRTLRTISGIKHRSLLTLTEMATAADNIGLMVEVYILSEVQHNRFSRMIYYAGLMGSNKFQLPPINILITNSHCAIIDDVSVKDFGCCIRCRTWIKVTNNDHFNNCNLCRKCGRRFSPNHKCPKAKEYARKTVKKNTKLNHSSFTCGSNVYFADLETFPDADQVMQVYSAAIISITTLTAEDPIEHVRCEEYCGPGGFDRFCQYLMTLTGTVVFYNGSRFDLFFVLKWIIEQRIQIKSYMKDSKCNKIISLEVGNIKFWDMCLFTLGSLASTCKAFKVPAKFCKKDFDHSLIKNWDDVFNNRDTIIEYNSYDVISLGFAFKAFSSTIFKLYQFNVTEAVTLSNMAYGIWTNKYATEALLSQIMIPDRETYDFVRRGLFGGRCCPQKSYFISREYSSVIGVLENDNRLMTNVEVYSYVTDYLVYLDVVSLYPYSSVLGEFPIGTPKMLSGGALIRLLRKFPSTTLTDHEKEFVKCCIAEVDVDCPDDLITPFLLARSEKGALIHDLLPKRHQVYDGATMLEALRLGYTFKKVHKCLKFKKLGNPLRTYMEYAFAQKNISEKGSCEYACHKYLMNGLTGKFSQAIIEGDWKIFYDDSALRELKDYGSILQFEWLLNDEGADIGFAAEIRNDKAGPNKPLQLGVSILAHSRVLMSIYTDFIGGYRDPKAMSYYGDTDSMIVHSSAYIKAMEKDVTHQIFGDDFGRLSNEYKNCKIIKAVFLSPKTYCLEILSSECKVRWSIRAKGVPQDISDVDVEDYYKNHDQDIVETESDLKTINYTLFDAQDNFLSSRKYLNMPYFESMLLFDCYVIVKYGTMKRRLHSKETGGLASQIKLSLGSERTINKNRWWEEGKRLYNGMAVNGGPTYPPGHKLVNKLL